MVFTFWLWVLLLLLLLFGKTLQLGYGCPNRLRNKRFSTFAKLKLHFCLSGSNFDATPSIGRVNVVVVVVVVVSLLLLLSLKLPLTLFLMLMLSLLTIYLLLSLMLSLMLSWCCLWSCLDVVFLVLSRKIYSSMGRVKLAGKTPFVSGLPSTYPKYHPSSASSGSS